MVLQSRSHHQNPYSTLKTPLLSQAYPYNTSRLSDLNHPLALEVAESTEWILGEMQCAGSLAFFWLCALCVL